MKKFTLTMLLFLGLGFSAMAQGGGLFEMGNTKNGGTSNESGLMLPTAHNMDGDQSAAPLGTGTALLLGLGAAYAAAKSRKNKNNKSRRFMVAAMLLFMAPAMTVMGQTRATYSLTPDQTSTGSSSTNYITTLTEFTYNSMSWKMNQWNPSTLQIKTNQSSAASEFRFYNTSAMPGRITQVVLKFSALTLSNTSNTGFMFVGGTSEVTATTGGTAGTWNNTEKTITWTPGSSENFTYFAFYQNGKVATGTNKLATEDAIVVTYQTGSTPTTYTVTFDAGNGTFVGNTDFPNASNTVEAGTYELPSATPATGYTFDGWLSTGSSTPITGNYTVSGNVDFTAQYTQNSGSGTMTATLTQSNLELSGSYTTNTEKTVDGITYIYTDLMKSSTNIQAKATSGTIKNTTAYPGDITSVVITHSGTARATTINGSADGTNWTQIATGDGSITADFSGKGYKYFQITRGINAAYWEKIEITYSTNSSSLSQSNLTISNQSTDLTFDLYNNATAQVINYTTSSTGAITITPATSDYFSYVHDATTKTITVTPIAVTPSAQTVTISQEADDNYYAGTATFTVSVANSDPNVPGTVNNPYTVAQAIENTPSNGNVYIQGIVSSFYNTSIVGDGSNYRYYISDDGSTTTQLLVYKGKGLNQATFTNANDLLVGDEVVICGSLITYQNASEVAANNYLYTWNRPTAVVEAPTFSPAAGTYTSAQTVTLSCTTTGATIYYTLDGSQPTNESTEYTEALTISNTTTVKAIAYVGTASSTVATATYHFCSANNPYTVTEALAFYEYPANGIYVEGIVSTAPTSNPSSGKLTYYISVNGQATNQLQVYKGKDLNNEDFTSKDDIQVGDIVTVFGDVKIYNGTKEFDEGNYLVSFERPTPPVQEYTLTIDNPANVTITAVYGTEGVLSNGDSDDIESGTEITVTVNVASGYVLDALTVTGENNQTVEVTVNNGVYTFNMPAFNATVSATLSVATTGTYTLATSITSGKQYIIVGQSNSKYYAMGDDKSNNRYAYEISLNETTATANIATNNAVHEFTITSLGEDYYSIMDATTNGGYLYAASSGSNYLKTEATLDENHNGDWKITITNGSFSVVADKSTNRNVMQFNHGNILFACYSSASQHPVFLYEKVETVTYDLTINGYTSNDNGWNLIASPVAISPADVENMTSNTYDLYYFDKNQEKEWINYKEGTDTYNPNFDLEPGKGYLYANSSDVTLKFTGNLYDGDGQITLEEAGWHLIGNPYYNTTTNIGRDFYRMNNNHDGLIAGTANDNVNAWEGIFVQTTEDGEIVTFAPVQNTQTGDKSAVEMNLSRNSNVIDRAIVRFGNSNTLPKFQLFENSTKLYIAQNGEDYAIVGAEEQGEMPVNFKAAENGTYTLTVSAPLNSHLSPLTFNYLHLIDNMTGADIDLLANPSYSFDAQPDDYEARFRLVFSAKSDNASIDEPFAFVSDGQIILTDGDAFNATVQVIDMMGRVLDTQNGVRTLSTLNMTPGVYVLRLLDGNTTRTQKIVVE